MTGKVLWLPNATHIDLNDWQPCDGGPAKAIAHITWDKNATVAHPADLVPYENVRDYFAHGGSGVAPHVLWDPFTGRFAQYFQANSRSKSLVDLAGGTRTNRAGSVVIQIEALFFPYCRVNGVVYPTLASTPCIGWHALHDWISSWGVPDAWPMGKPVDFNSNRSESTWETHAGWYGHSQVPENTHQDPGSWPAFPVKETDVLLTDRVAEAKMPNGYIPTVADILNGTKESDTLITALSAKVDKDAAAMNVKLDAALGDVAALAVKLDAVLTKLNSK